MENPKPPKYPVISLEFMESSLAYEAIISGMTDDSIVKYTYRLEDGKLITEEMTFAEFTAKVFTTGDIPQINDEYQEGDEFS